MSLPDRIRTAVDRLRTRLSPLQQGLLAGAVVVAVLAVPLGIAAASSGSDEAATPTTTSTTDKAKQGKPVRHNEPRCPNPSGKPKADAPDHGGKQEQDKPKQAEPKNDGKAQQDGKPKNGGKPKHDGKGKHDGKAQQDGKPKNDGKAQQDGKPKNDNKGKDQNDGSNPTRSQQRANSTRAGGEQPKQQNDKPEQQNQKPEQKDGKPKQRDGKATCRPATPAAKPQKLAKPPKPRPPMAPLTGVLGTFEGRTNRPALVVKIDNVPAARPQAGLNQADIVIEEPVEGDFTRLAAVFHSTDSSGVGPVRSARTSDLELMPLFGRPIFASSGGNSGVIPQVQAANLVDMGDHVPGTPYYRLATRYAPHNLFSSTLDLYAGAPEQPAPPPQIFDYREPDDTAPKGAIPVGGIALSFGGPERSRFTWNPATERWNRYMDGSPHVDANGEQIAPKNVVVLEIDYDYSNQLGRSVPHALVHGQGSAIVLTGGQAIRGQWIRPTINDRLRLIDPHGDPIELNRGQTFIELPIRGGWAFI